MITDGWIAVGALLLVALIGFTFATWGAAHGLLALAVFLAPVLWGKARHGGANR